ncbi:LPS translocon maturation chaperone LptM [Paucibacter hankyongi]|uniref:LPS translocon maturation chaperone LptM n=1 Tax=Paucibacter hankyongi TaxID=3133434 RepID=UPI00403540D4
MMKTTSETLTRPASVGRSTPTAHPAGAKRSSRLVCVAGLGLLMLTTACGQKGPLTLPRGATTAATSQPAPQPEVPAKAAASAPL